MERISNSVLLICQTGVMRFQQRTEICTKGFIFQLAQFLITGIQNKLKSSINSCIIVLFALWCFELALRLLLSDHPQRRNLSATCIHSHLLRPRNMFYLLKWNNKCTPVGRPLFQIVFVCRHLPRETNGPTNSCVTGKEKVYEWVWGHGCPRSLVTICLRRSSCQLLFLSLRQSSLSLPVHCSHMTWAAISQIAGFMLSAFASVQDCSFFLSLWVFCVPLVFLCQTRSVSMPPVLTAGLCF